MSGCCWLPVTMPMQKRGADGRRTMPKIPLPFSPLGCGASSSFPRTPRRAGALEKRPLYKHLRGRCQAGKKFFLTRLREGEPLSAADEGCGWIFHLDSHVLPL